MKKNDATDKARSNEMQDNAGMGNKDKCKTDVKSKNQSSKKCK